MEFYPLHSYNQEFKKVTFSEKRKYIFREISDIYFFRIEWEF